jgi:hypothetical protein
MSQQPPDRPTERWQPPQQPTQPLPGWGQQPTQPQWGPPPGEPPPQPPPGPPYGQQPGWGPPPRQPAAPQGPTQRRLWYQRWWAIGTAGFLLGAIVASAGSSNQKPQTVTETRVTERVVWTPECEKIQNQTERGQCERIMAGYNHRYNQRRLLSLQRNPSRRPLHPQNPRTQTALMKSGRRLSRVHIRRAHLPVVHAIGRASAILMAIRFMPITLVKVR